MGLKVVVYIFSINTTNKPYLTCVQYVNQTLKKDKKRRKRKEKLKRKKKSNPHPKGQHISHTQVAFEFCCEVCMHDPPYMSSFQISFSVVLFGKKKIIL